MTTNTVAGRIYYLFNNMVSNNQTPFGLLINRENLTKLIEENSEDIFINFLVCIQEQKDLDLITLEEYEQLVDSTKFKAS